MRNTTSAYIRACQFMGFEMVCTGGNCSALQLVTREGDDGAYLLITLESDPITPASLLAGPVVVGFYEGERSESVSETIYPTLLAAFQDLYGKAEGTDYPDEIRG